MNKTSKHTQRAGDKTEKRFWTRERYLQILALLFVVALSVFLLLNRDKVAELQVYGYLGVFIISIITCSSIVVPVPGWILIATMAFALNNPFLVGIVSGLGGTIGEMTGYLLGYGGRLAVDNVGLYTRMVRWMKRWGSVTIFVLALIPNPLFDVAGAAAGSLRFPVWKFLLFGAAGRIPKHILFAYIGVWGFQFLPL
ncbi:MAG: VTT domain-containing protein [Dehalococcoidia bacterium]|nr:VTT domain-containing protein [Dehalococcoidia bacterium]